MTRPRSARNPSDARLPAEAPSNVPLPAQESADEQPDDYVCCAIPYSECCPEEEKFIFWGERICLITGILAGTGAGAVLLKTENLDKFLTEQFENNSIGGGFGVALVFLILACGGGVITRYCFGAQVGRICEDFAKASFSLTKSTINCLAACCHSFFSAKNNAAQRDLNLQPQIQVSIPPPPPIQLRVIQNLYTINEVDEEDEKVQQPVGTTENQQGQVQAAQPNNEVRLVIDPIEQQEDCKKPSPEIEPEIKEDILITPNKQNMAKQLKLSWLGNQKKNSRQNYIADTREQQDDYKIPARPAGQTGLEVKEKPLATSNKQKRANTIRLSWLRDQRARQNHGQERAKSQKTNKLRAAAI